MGVATHQMHEPGMVRNTSPQGCSPESSVTRCMLDARWGCRPTLSVDPGWREVPAPERILRVMKWRVTDDIPLGVATLDDAGLGW